MIYYYGLSAEWQRSSVIVATYGYARCVLNGTANRKDIALASAETLWHDLWRKMYVFCPLLLSNTNVSEHVKRTHSYRAIQNPRQLKSIIYPLYRLGNETSISVAVKEHFCFYFEIFRKSTFPWSKECCFATLILFHFLSFPCRISCIMTDVWLRCADG